MEGPGNWGSLRPSALPPSGARRKDRRKAKTKRANFLFEPQAEETSPISTMSSGLLAFKAERNRPPRNEHTYLQVSFRTTFKKLL